MTERKRLECVNSDQEHEILQLMRGFAIIMVVLQHSVVLFFHSPAADELLSTCVFIDVHIFMFVSGYLFQKNSEKYKTMGIKHFTLKKLKSIGIPYLFWESILYFGTFFLYLIPNVGVNLCQNVLHFPRLSLPQIFFGLLTFRYSYIELYWFLYALFCVMMIHYVFIKFSSRIEFTLICFLLVGIMAVFFKNDVYILTKISRSLLTFGLGRWFQRSGIHKNILYDWKIYCTVAVAFLLRHIPLVTNYHYVNDIFLSFRITLFGIIGIVVFYTVSVLMVSYGVKLRRLFSYLGDYSFAIFLLHNPWFVYTTGFAAKKLSLPAEVGVVISFFAGFLFPIVIYKFIIKKNQTLSLVMLGR